MISIDTQLNHAVFEWEDVEGIMKFLTTITKGEPMCFRYVVSADDVNVIVYGPEPISEANAASYYQGVLEAQM